MKPFFWAIDRLWIFLFLTCANLYDTAAQNPSNPQTVFEAANAAYQAGNFAQALTQYEALQKAGQQSAALETHLGDAHFRLHHLGLAMVHYRRALRLDAAYSETRSNLEAANTHITQATEPLEAFFLTRFLRAIGHLCTSKIWSILAIVCLWLSAAGAATWLFATVREWKKRGFTTAVVLGILSVIAYLFANNAAWVERDNSIGIVTTAQSTLRLAPDEVAKNIGILHEGEAVQVLEAVGGWYKVLVVNGEQGWLTKEGVTMVVEK